MAKTIVISAGHNPATDVGAVGQGQYEANDNVRMADRVIQYLQAWGIPNAKMPHDVGDLQSEINWVNNNFAAGTAYAIQIHRNAGGGTGNEVWTAHNLEQWPLATSILNAMTELTGLKSRGVKDIQASNWPLGWINYINCESVLIEARFIDVDSITDADDYLDAYAIACGIADFIGVKRGLSLEQEATNKAETARLAEVARLKAIADAKAATDKLAADLKAKQVAEQLAADKLAAELAAQKAELERLADEKADEIATQAITIATDSPLDVENHKLLLSIKMMLVNFIGWVKKTLTGVTK